MKVNRVSGRVLQGPYEPVYVYEAPVRFWHWAMMLCMTALAVTGYLISRPLPAIGGEATFSYFFANVRVIHFIAAMLFVVLFVVRLVWAVIGNHHARSIFIPPVWSGEWWNGLFSQAAYYLFLRKEPLPLGGPQPAGAARHVLHVRAGRRSSSSSPGCRCSPSSTAGDRRG